MKINGRERRIKPDLKDMMSSFFLSSFFISDLFLCLLVKFIS